MEANTRTTDPPTSNGAADAPGRGLVFVPAQPTSYVTPAMALRWLSTKAPNRNLRSETVAAFARDMAAGRWAKTGESIKFAKDGRLIDGQHRLAAIVQADIAVPLVIVGNLELDAQNYMDSGVKRSASDALQLGGFTNPGTLAAVARLCVNYQRGIFRTAESNRLVKVSNAEILEFVTADTVVDGATQVAFKCRSIPAPCSIIGFVLWLTMQVDDESARQFFTDLNEHRTSGNGDPRAALLKRLATIRESRARPGAATISYLFLRAWNACRAGESLTIMRTADSRGPYPFPVPA